MTLIELESMLRENGNLIFYHEDTGIYGQILLESGTIAYTAGDELHYDIEEFIEYITEDMLFLPQ